MQSMKLMKFVAVIKNQVEKGRGYPMILILSHNEAVIEEKREGL